MQRATKTKKTNIKKPTTAAHFKPLSTTTRKPIKQKKLTSTLSSISAFQSPPTISVPSNFTPLSTSIQSSKFSSFSHTPKKHGLSDVFEEISSIASLFKHHPQQSLDILTHTKLFIDRDAPMTPMRRMKHLLAQPAIYAAAMLTKDENAPAPTALTPSDLPSDLPVPVLQGRKLHQTDGIEILAPADGAALMEPIISDFVPPHPSRTIPIVHDGMEWDEPNFLFRPFIQVIDELHHLTGLPWWATLISWAWILRTCISPLTYKQQASMVRFTLVQPEMLKIRKDMRGLDPKSNTFKQKQQEIRDLYKHHGVGPFTSIFWAMSAIPFYILSFMAIRNMSNSPYYTAEFVVGGFMPYTNLSASAGWELAAVNAFVNLVVLHTSQAVPLHQMQKMQKIMFAFSHVLIIGFIPVLSNINTASLIYFISNNGFSIFFQKLFYSNFFRKMAGLPSKDEVNAVREIVTEMSQNPLAAGNDLPQGANKNAYVLDNASHKKVEAAATANVLAQARSLVSKKESERKIFATGGAEALESTRLQQEKQKIQKEKDNIQSMQNYVQGKPADKDIYVPNTTAPKNNASSSKIPSRRGWKKH